MILSKAVAINVGVNTKPNWGGFRGPIFSDGSFHFIHIPWKQKYGMIDPPPPRYREMPYAAYVPEKLLDHHVLISPDFSNCTYASTPSALANKSLFNLRHEDYLLFYATLCYNNGKEKESWINPAWGAYIIGFFKVDFICKSLKQILANEAAYEAFKNYSWFKSQLEVGDLEVIVPWVKGIREESGLLKKAVPLSSPNDPQKWNSLTCELFRTSRGKKLNVDRKARFQTVLTCEGDNLDRLLTKCNLRKQKCD